MENNDGMERRNGQVLFTHNKGLDNPWLAMVEFVVGFTILGIVIYLNPSEPPYPDLAVDYDTGKIYNVDFAPEPFDIGYELDYWGMLSNAE